MDLHARDTACCAVSTAAKSAAAVYLSTIATFGAKTTVTYTAKGIVYLVTKALAGIHHSPAAAKAVGKHLVK